tara:strand:- start:9027 stop:9536 length:510 start_codon:yes stop_codon:yes gene_type:complete
MSVTNTILNQAGDKALNRFVRQLSKIRTGSTMKMSTTGNLANSLRVVISNLGGFTQLEIKGAEYGLTLNTAKPTPFSWSGLGKEGVKSYYILGLLRWLKHKKGLTGRPALQAAFRIAKTAREQATTTPQNPGWIKEIKQHVDRDINEHLSLKTKFEVSNSVHKTLNINI